jgi:hypothetical protein
MNLNTMNIEETSTNFNKPSKGSRFFINKKLIAFILFTIIILLFSAILFTYNRCDNSYSYHRNGINNDNNENDNKSYQYDNNEKNRNDKCYDVFSDWIIKYDRSKLSSPTTTTKQKVKKVNYRLPDHLIPTYYDITLKAYFNVSSRPVNYDGFVLITINCYKDSSNLILHSGPHIAIQSVKIKSITDKSFDIVTLSNWTFTNETDFLTINMIDNVQLKKDNKYLVNITFNSIFKQKVDNGLYSSSYRTNDGNLRWLITSQMQPTHAREAFPCFDEPNKKAKFKITVIHDASLKALSNMPIKSSIFL